MTYNSSPRRRFTKKQRAEFLAKHKAICCECGEPITEGQAWAVEHTIPRELMPDKAADEDHNLKPIHAHPLPCHKIKTARDVKLIARSNRIRRANGPVDQRKKSKKPIRARPFQPGQRKMQSKPFPTKRRDR